MQNIFWYNVQWLRLLASNAGSAELIPGWETKIPRAQGAKKVSKTNKIPDPMELTFQAGRQIIIKLESEGDKCISLLEPYNLDVLDRNVRCELELEVSEQGVGSVSSF